MSQPISLAQVASRARQAQSLANGARLLRGASSRGRFPEVRGRLVLRNRGQLLVGDRFRAAAWPLPSKVEVGPNGHLSIGDHAFLNFGVDIFASGKITIGHNVRIAPFVSIVDDAMHQVEPTQPRRQAPIVIGDNVWLGRGVTVLPGVRIGDHAVIAAGSVVSRDVPDRVVAGGAPAEVLRQLEVPDGWHRV